MQQDQTYFVFGFSLATFIIVVLGIQFFSKRDRIVEELTKIISPKAAHFAYWILVSMFLYGLLSTAKGVFMASIITHENYGPVAFFLYGSVISSIFSFCEGALYYAQVAAMIVATIALLKYLQIKRREIVK